jgi:S1-C subfamily serine protease
MKRTSLYSRSTRAIPKIPGDGEAQPTAPPPPSLRARLKAFAERHDRALMLVSGFLAALLAFGIYALTMPTAQKLTQNDIDAAVLHTLQKQPPEPSHASTAYDVIRPSVVLVRHLGKDEENATSTGEESHEENNQLPGPESKESQDNHPNEQESGREDAAKNARNLPLRGIATGVVFSDDGMIFTNLHVIIGAEKLGVVFFDGTESDVDILNVQPQNDLAVLQARTLPDDLVPATLRSTRGLQTGDEVLAVGFPFGIGPTATWGVVSGLRREHYSKEGRRNLIDLIQFDAAANPGNSGGPLVTREGDVVGIVTSILNPTDQGFFVGIAFAVPIENAATAAGMSPF